MTQLSAQSIRRLCESMRPMITPFEAEKQIINGKSFGLSGASYDVRIAHDLTLVPHEAALAHTVEDFDMPHDVVGYVVDKSSYARRFVSALNTLIDPGFVGNLTLELVNLSRDTIMIKAGDPIVQVAFHWLDAMTERPYGPKSKYYGQTKGAHPARFEKPDGSWSNRPD